MRLGTNAHKDGGSDRTCLWYGFEANADENSASKIADVLATGIEFASLR
jgi:hypothetical protein